MRGLSTSRRRRARLVTPPLPMYRFGRLEAAQPFQRAKDGDHDQVGERELLAQLAPGADVLCQGPGSLDAGAREDQSQRERRRTPDETRRRHEKSLYRPLPAAAFAGSRDTCQPPRRARSSTPHPLLIPQASQESQGGGGGAGSARQTDTCPCSPGTLYPVTCQWTRARGRRPCEAHGRNLRSRLQLLQCSRRGGRG